MILGYGNKKMICFLLLLLTGVLLLGGCRKKRPGAPAEASTSIRDMNPAHLDDITMNGMVDDILDQMTLEEKVGQMFLVSTDSLDYDAETSVTDQMKDRLGKYHIGGIIYFSFNIKDRDQITSFIREAQEAYKIPLFTAVDEEGGSVARIANTEGMGVTIFPPMAEIGKSGDPTSAYALGKTLAQDLSDLGFNVDFAPVADIVTNTENTEIGDRSFGSDPDLVSQFVSQEVKGLQENGVCSTLKHFPGQGDTSEDTHRGYVDLETSIDRLREVEFLPFQAGIEAGADFVMVSHVSVKAVTGQEVPASLSKLMISDILRDELQYDGIIITDALNMKSITKFYDSGQAALKAVKAGVDMILMPDDMEEAYTEVLDAVKRGSIDESRIEESVRRILTAKIRRGILPLTSELIHGGEE